MGKHRPLEKVNALFTVHSSIIDLKAIDNGCSGLVGSHLLVPTCLFFHLTGTTTAKREWHINVYILFDIRNRMSIERPTLFFIFRLINYCNDTALLKFNKLNLKKLMNWKSSFCRLLLTNENCDLININQSCCKYNLINIENWKSLV